MLSFAESLQGRDLGHLRVIAHLWGDELAEQEIQAAILHLKSELLTASRVTEMVSNLGEEERDALAQLVVHSGHLPWAQFRRRYGEIREMGAARRDREQPYAHPISSSETLWYRGLIGRAFFDAGAGPEEFAYIPEEFLTLLPHPDEAQATLIGRQASAVDYADIFPASDQILDHACTYLSAVRVGVPMPDVFLTQAGEKLTSSCLGSILTSAGLMDIDGKPITEPVRSFLEAGRGEALFLLYSHWKTSSTINELHMLPGLELEGIWKSDPQRTRRAILDYLSHIPEDTWWDLNAFIAAIKRHSPDFQRPAGDYDSWFIREKTSGEYLRGFEHWDEVDGRLIRFLITGPLFWMGVLDLARREDGSEVTAFRLSSWSKALRKDKAPRGLAVEREALVVRSDAHISARRLVPRSVRYQLARFCEWERETPDEYLFRISPASLLRARSQGLKVIQLITMLTRHSKAVPPSLQKALEGWEKQGSQARLEQVVVLRVSSEEILLALRKSRASRFLGEPISPTAITVKDGAVAKVLGALAELGYLGEVRGDLDEG